MPEANRHVPGCPATKQASGSLLKDWQPAWLPILHGLLLAVFIGVIYYPTLDVPFVFDDFPNIVENPAVHPEKLADLREVFNSPISTTRPLALLSFALNYLLGGLDVFGYHLVNILLHIANALLLYQLIVLLPLLPTTDAPAAGSGQRNLAFWGAALWAVNPVQSQAVTYIVQRMAAMGTFFYLAGLSIFLLWRRKKIGRTPALSLLCLCFLLGLASKEIIIPLPLALLLLDYLLFPASTAAKRSKAVPMIALLVAIIPGLLLLQGRLPEWFATYPHRNFSPWERIMTEWRVVWHYVSLYLLPLPTRLHLAYDLPISRSLLAPWTTLPSLLAMIVTWYAAWQARVSRPVVSFAVLFFFLALSVESTFANLEIAFIHRLYLPTVLLGPAFLLLLPEKALRRAGPVLLLVLAFWSYWTIVRNDEWKHAETFWAGDMERGASPARALNNQAAERSDAGDFPAAIDLLRQALLVSSTAEEKKIVLYNLGADLFLENRFEEALTVFREIVRDYGAYRQSCLFVGQILIKQEKTEEVRRLIGWLVEQEEHRYEARILEGNLLTGEKKYTVATALLRRTIAEEPAALIDRQLKLRLELARIFLLANDIRQAHATYLEITKLFPQNYFAWTQLYHMLAAGGDTERAAIVRRFLEGSGVQVRGLPAPRQENNAAGNVTTQSALPLK